MIGNLASLFRFELADADEQLIPTTRASHVIAARRGPTNVGCLYADDTKYRYTVEVSLHRGVASVKYLAWIEK